MELLKLARIAPLCLLLAGCLQEPDRARAEAGQAEKPGAVEKTGDPYMDHLLASGIRKRDIVLQDGKYIVQKDMIFTKDALDRAIMSIAPLAKTAQTHAENYSRCVKDINLVTRIRVYIRTSGTGAVGPNWASAVRSAMTGWNNIPGSAVNFAETSSPLTSDLQIFTEPPPYSGALAWCYMRWHDQVVANRIGADPALENNSVFSLNSKVHAMKHELGHALNMDHTDQQYQDVVDGAGNFLYYKKGIAGTPETDPNSVFNSQLGTPMDFSSWDKVAIRNLYPSAAISVRLTNNNLVVEGPTTLSTNVKEFQQEGDTVIVLKHDGSVWGRLGINGSFQELWSASAGAATSFKLSKGYLGLVTQSRTFYAKRINVTAWYTQTTGNAIRIDMDGSQDMYAVLTSSGALVAKRGLQNPTWVSQNAGSGTITDFQLEGARLVWLRNGTLYGRSDATSGGISTLRTGVQAFQLEKNRIAALTNGTLIAQDGMGTNWTTLFSQVSKFQLSNTRIGALEAGTNTLYVCEGINPGGFDGSHENVASFHLKDYYVAVITTSGQVRATYDAYGGYTNSWLDYGTGGAAFMQR